MKRCFKCGVVKSAEDFYRHPNMTDGRLGKCKDCTKLDMRNDRHTKPRVRKYDRERAALPHRVVLRQRVTREWVRKHPEWVTAQRRAQRAMKKGLIIKPSLCEGCGLEHALQKHHPDYSKPLAVVWLCKPCHALADKIRRRLEAHREGAA